MQNFTKVQICASRMRELLESTYPSLFSHGGVALILGTGLGGVADFLENPCIIPFSALPGFPVSGVSSHAGRFLVGRYQGVPVCIQQGRCHLYEGYSPAEVSMGTRVMAALGANSLVVTNAAGAINPVYASGEVMCITDHINATGLSPLTGPNHDAAGPRFPDMSAAYDPALREIAVQLARRLGLGLQQGVYLSVTGPQLETPAETRAFRLLGADAVGMSTVMEVIAARHLGMRVLGFSCLSNKNLPDCMAEATLEDIITMAAQAGETLTTLLQDLIPLVYAA